MTVAWRADQGVATPVNYGPIEMTNLDWNLIPLMGAAPYDIPLPSFISFFGLFQNTN